MDGAVAGAEQFTAEYLAGFTPANKVSSVTTGVGAYLRAADKEGPLRRTLDGMLHAVYGATAPESFIGRVGRPGPYHHPLLLLVDVEVAGSDAGPLVVARELLTAASDSPAVVTAVAWRAEGLVRLLVRGACGSASCSCVQGFKLSPCTPFLTGASTEDLGSFTLSQCLHYLLLPRLCPATRGHLCHCVAFAHAGGSDTAQPEAPLVVLTIAAAWRLLTQSPPRRALPQVQADEAEAIAALTPALAPILAAGPTRRALVGWAAGASAPGGSGAPATGSDKVVAALVALGVTCARPVWIQHGYVMHADADPCSTA